MVSFPQTPKSAVPQARVCQPSPVPPHLGPFWQEQVGASTVHQEILSPGDDPQPLPHAESPSQLSIKCFPRYCWALIGERGAPHNFTARPWLRCGHSWHQEEEPTLCPVSWELWCGWDGWEIEQGKEGVFSPIPLLLSPGNGGDAEY